MAVAKIYNENTGQWEAAITGPSGVVDVTSPITNTGTPTEANIGIDESALFTGGTEGYTALSNGTAGLSYQPVSHNYIINGAFDIWQRGTSFDFLSSADGYAADRFYLQNFGGDLEISRSTDVPNGFTYSSKLQRPSGNTTENLFRVGQSLENIDCSFLIGKVVTVSAWVKAGANFSASDFSINVFSAEGVDENLIVAGTNRTNQFAVIGTATTDWQRFDGTVTIPSTATQVAVGLQFSSEGTAGADDSLYITGVQLEAGSIATPFKRNANNIAGEKLACQSYFQRWGGGNSAGYYATGQELLSNRARVTTYLPVEMRAKPSISFGPNVGYAGGAGSQTPTLFLNQSTEQVINCYLEISGGSAGGQAFLHDNSTDSYFDADAEL